jgi:hypothetical protein
MSELIPYLGSAAVVLLFFGCLYAMSSGAYGDWVREFYAKRDRPQKLFDNDSDSDKRSI